MRDRFRLRDVIEDDRRRERFCRFMEPAGLIKGGRIVPHWMLDGTSFWYVEGAPHHTVIFRVDGETGRIAPLFDVGKTRKALAALVGYDPPYHGLPFETFTELVGERYQFAFEGTGYVLSIESYSIEVANAQAGLSQYMGTISRLMGGDLLERSTPRPYRRPRWVGEPMLVTEAPSPDRRWFASLKDGNIMLRSPIDDRVVPLTTDGTPEFAWDVEAPRPKLTVGQELIQHLLNPWSPDGNRLFAIKFDRRAVPEVPLVRYLGREQEICPVKMQRAGGPMDIAHPHVIDLLAKRTLRFDVGPTEDQFFTLIGWLPNGQEVLFTRHSRDFKTVDVLAGNPADGSVRIVLSESAKTFVAIQHDVIFSGDNHVTLLPDGSGLIWRSSRSGWNQFYLYALNGTLLGALTRGEFPVIDVVAIDQPDGWVYFTAHHDQERPYDTHLCRVKLSGDELQRLTRLDGENAVCISPSKKTFSVVNSRPDRPFRTDFHACDGSLLATVQQADVSALDDLGYVAPEEFKVTAADGKTILWGIMHRPADFDPKKKYPVINHLYCGPQTTHVAHHFGLGEHSHPRLDRALAQLGYVVISVDARGTPERAKAFHDVVYGNWGRNEIADHVSALRELAKRYAFIDLSRVGVWGHSWGGYFTIRALAQASEVFRVGVAVAPGIDPYDLILYEPYLDMPVRAKAAYDYASNYPLAEKIKGKLMVLVGTADPTPYFNTLKMTRCLIDAGVDHEFVVLPDAGHYFMGHDDDYFVHKLVSHFETHLKHRGAAENRSVESAFRSARRVETVSR